MKTIRWGIIGAGNISSSFADALNTMTDTKLEAVAARDLERAQAFAKRFQIGKAYGSYEEIAKDPDIDVIYIGTLHTEHVANAALCIKNGKAVLCEKPFTINRKEADYLVSLAKEHKVFLMEAMWTKFLPVNQVVKSWLQEKKIGDILTANVSFGFRAGFNRNSRLFNPEMAGGALLDVGVYTINYASYMMGKLPDQVESLAVMGDSMVDEQNSIIFRYNDGAIANIHSAVSSDLGQDAFIVGTKGKIRIPIFWRAEYAELYDESGKLTLTSEIKFKKNGYEYEAEEVNHCLRENKLESEINPLDNTLNMLGIMDSIRAKWGLVYPQERN
jgi:predicted dehydrogenase